jgi:uncharacterized protein (DUF2141 family)
MKLSRIALAASLMFMTSPILAAEIQVQVTGANTAVGVIAMALFAGEDNYLKEPAARMKFAIAKDGSAQGAFENVVPRDYTIVALHHKNVNGEMDKNFIGYPTESFGFSNNAKPSMGPPDYKEAVFTVADEKIGQVIALIVMD